MEKSQTRSEFDERRAERGTAGSTDARKPLEGDFRKVREQSKSKTFLRTDALEEMEISDECSAYLQRSQTGKVQSWLGLAHLLRAMSVCCL